jgi:hypothetical protein
MKAAWIALATIVACGALAQSNPPPPPKVEHGRQEQSHAADCAQLRNNHCADSPQLPAAVMVNVAPSPQRNENTPNNKNNSASPEKPGWSIHDPNSVIAVFTIVLALIGIAQVCAGLLQWRTYTAQTEIFTAQNRAFVFLETLKWEPMIIDSDNRETAWRSVAIIKNSGNTPARNLIVDIQSMGVVDQLESVFGLTPNYSAAKKFFIGPQTRVSVDGPQFDTRDIEKSTSQEKRHFLIWGWMEYGDIFPSTERHRTEFCMELSADTVVDPSDGSYRHVPRFVMYPRHNGAEGECMHRPRPPSI